MNTKFKKLALSAAITAALGGVSMPTHALIQGSAGEALLVPFVVYDTVDSLPGSADVVNTIIELTIPGTVGLDTIPNHYTASHTTPQYVQPLTSPPVLGGILYDNPALTPNDIHWFFFDHRSGHLLNGSIPVSPDLYFSFNWGDIVKARNPSLIGEKGYLIFGTHKAQGHAAADFSFFGDAHLVFTPDSTRPLVKVAADIPVLPMNDGVDTPAQLASQRPTVDNQVIYDAAGIPSQASPLISGMRTNWSDGIQNVTSFDLALSDRRSPTLHVFWNDVNLGSRPGHPGQPIIGTTVPPLIGGPGASYNVYDDNEVSCSGSIEFPDELNVVWVSPKENQALGRSLRWVDHAFDLCYPSSAANIHGGFVQYIINEWIDTNSNTPESSAVAFSITLTEPSSGAIFSIDTPTMHTVLGHERGKFQ